MPSLFAVGTIAGSLWESRERKRRSFSGRAAYAVDKIPDDVWGAIGSLIVLSVLVLGFLFGVGAVSLVLIAGLGVPSVVVFAVIATFIFAVLCLGALAWLGQRRAYEMEVQKERARLERVADRRLAEADAEGQRLRQRAERYRSRAQNHN